MRPGQAAPVFVKCLLKPAISTIPSMRPGQAAPVFLALPERMRLPRSTFNEAGAGCPGIHVRDRLRRPVRLVPSMRPGQAAPVFGDATITIRTTMVPSMRPGQAAPVFQRRAMSRPALPSSAFNEAGAGCPGIHHWAYRQNRPIFALQ